MSKPTTGFRVSVENEVEWTLAETQVYKKHLGGGGDQQWGAWDWVLGRFA